MSRKAIPSWYFVLVAVKKDDQYLVVQEQKGNQDWYLPAGRVEAGESFIDAAHRETLEEAGIPINLTGIVKIQHTPGDGTARVRVIFLAEPADDTPPKSIADKESLQADWFTLEEIKKLPLRGAEVVEIFEHLEFNPKISPLKILGTEGGIL